MSDSVSEARKNHAEQRQLFDRTAAISYALLEVQNALRAVGSFTIAPFELSFVPHTLESPADLPSIVPPELHRQELLGTVTRNISCLNLG